MALNINTTSTSGISSTIQTWYDRKLIENMKPKLVHYEYGQRRPAPMNGGRLVNFRKWTPFQAVTTALTQGVVPDGQTLAMTEVSGTLQGYGGYVAISDMLDMTAIDPVADEAVELMADQGALSLDTIIRDVLHSGTNVQYAGGQAARNTLTPEHKLTVEDLRKAVRTLKRNNTPTFQREGHAFYVAIVGPDTVYDLQSDATWQDVAKYQDKEKIFSGEIGRMFGVVVVESPNAKVFTSAGAAMTGGEVGQEYDVASTIVFGQNAYGVVDLEGRGNTRAIIKPAGSAGSSDPLDQITTVGWKVDAFVCKILQQGWLVRIEHGCSL